MLILLLPKPKNYFEFINVHEEVIQNIPVLRMTRLRIGIINIFLFIVVKDKLQIMIQMYLRCVSRCSCRL